MGDWATIGEVQPRDLSEATLELHWAVQIIAAAGATFGAASADDSHRAMSWNDGQRAFVGGPFAGPYPFRVAVRPEDLTLMLLDRGDEALGSLPLGGVTVDQAYEWLSLGLATYMGGPPPTLERPEYDMPEHALGTDATFTPAPTPEHATLAALYRQASSLLTELVSTRSDASPVLCWPHHFDVATLLTVEADEAGTPTRTVGAGFAPMGGGYDAWYWYVTPWPYPDAGALPELAGPGAWRTEGWTGAVLRGEELVDADAAFREAVVRKFLDVSVEAAIRALDG